jgi:hypothetical protein
MTTLKQITRKYGRLMRHVNTLHCNAALPHMRRHYYFLHKCLWERCTRELRRYATRPSSPSAIAHALQDTSRPSF